MKSYVMITGATGGLGKAFAAECAGRGWDLFLTDQSDEKLVPLAQGLERLFGINVRHVACDLADTSSREMFWDQVRKLGYRFHMLVNVAGLDHEGAFEERQPSELTGIIRLNIEGTVDITRRILAFRDPARVLRVITIGSLAGFYPMPLKAVYAASKRFLLDFNTAMRREFSPLDATFTVVCPAGMPTTPGSIEGIRAQGGMGRATTMNVGDVAGGSIHYALKGRGIYIPGWINQALRFLGGLLPPELVSWIVGRRWAEARRERNGNTPVHKGLVIGMASTSHWQKNASGH